MLYTVNLKIFFYFFTTYAGSSSAGGSANSANGLVVADTRSVNSAPNAAEFDKMRLTADFKYSSTIGSPPGFRGSYCGVLSFAPWSETSGGHGYQLAFGYNSTAHPRLVIRAADLSATSWGSWYKVYTSDDKPTPADIGAAASSHNHSADNITSGTLAVARGGTGTTSLVGGSGLIRKMFDNNLTSANYIPVFTDSWADGGYMNKSQFRNNLGLGNTTGALPVANGGTGASDAATARSNLGITLANLGAASSGHTHSYLPLSGGTCTGSITIKGGSLDVSASTVSSRQYGNSLNLKDKNGVSVGYLQITRETNGVIRHEFGIQRTVSGSTKYNYIRAGIGNSGNLEYGLASPAAFRSAIGITSGTGNPAASGTAGSIYIKYA